MWYSKAALGRNTLASMMPDISRVAGLSQRYTNHCIRATSIQTLDRAGFEARHITRITGHKSESSIKSYSKRLSENTKRLMSNTLSKPTGALNQVVAHNSDEETVRMQANHDVGDENDLRLEDLECIFNDENLFFEVQSSKTATNVTVNETHNQQLNILQQMPEHLVTHAGSATNKARPESSIHPTFNNCVVHFNVNYQ